MSTPLVFEGEFATLKVIPNAPAGGAVSILTDEDLTVAFFIPSLNDYAPSEALVAPGGVVDCASSKMRLTTAGSANVVIHHHA